MLDAILALLVSPSFQSVRYKGSEDAPRNSQWLSDNHNYSTSWHVTSLLMYSQARDIPIRKLSDHWEAKRATKCLGRWYFYRKCVLHACVESMGWRPEQSIVCTNVSVDEICLCWTILESNSSGKWVKFLPLSHRMKGFLMTICSSMLIPQTILVSAHVKLLRHSLWASLASTWTYRLF